MTGSHSQRLTGRVPLRELIGLHLGDDFCNESLDLEGGNNESKPVEGGGYFNGQIAS